MGKTQKGKRSGTPAERLANRDGQHVGDLVAFLNELPRKQATETIADFPVGRATQVFDSPDLRHAADLIQRLPLHRASAVLGRMAADRATDVLQSLSETRREEFLALLSPERQNDLRALLSYPRDTAGGLMTTEFVAVPSTWTVEDTLQHIRQLERERDTLHAIYVLDPTSRALLRTANLQRLIGGDPKASILSVCRDSRPVVVAPLADQEDVARLIAKYDLLAVPVVDNSGMILGIVTFDDVIDAMIEESTEDVQKLGGMEALERPYTDIGFFEMIRKRGGWLAILFLGEMLTASAMQHYEAAIASAVVLTLFIPLIMSSGGNSGSQAATLIIRALALQELRPGHWWRVALRELPVGITLGAILGVIGVARITLWQMAGFHDYGEHWQLVALTVGASLIGIVTFGSLAGSLLPFVLRALRFDPASASAPFVATLVDVSGIVIYFSIALLFLRGTLL